MAAAIQRLLARGISQEMMILLITLAVVAVFSLALDGFATFGNLITMTRNISILGIMALAMAVTIIGRGLDLSIVAVMVAGAATVIAMLESGFSLPVALVCGLVISMLIGAANGFVIAYLEVPPLFATLASTFVIGGAARTLMGRMNAYPPPEAEAFLALGQTRILGIPTPILCFAVMALLVHLILSRTVFGRFIYAMGDNTQTARLSGISVRQMLLGKYMLSGAIACVAGVFMTASVGSLNLRYVETTVIFDVILVVVIGGISLVGGRGGVFSVLVGTALIGTLLNGLTILNFSNLAQDVVKGFVLLGAIVIDNHLHPRDEETARQGD